MTDLRTRLLDAFQGVHERPIDYPQWGISGVLLREFVARERQAANEATVLDNADNPDQILYRAMLLQRCITDPSTGVPYTDGRLDASTGQPAIDPRTRKPIFTIDDVTELAEGRSLLFTTLWDDLLEVASMSQGAMFSRRAAPNGGERDQGAGTEGTGSTVDSPPHEVPGDTDERTSHADDAEQTDGQGAGAA